MDTQTIIWIVVAVVVALIVLALLGWAFKKKRTVEREAEASELRSDVRSRSGAIAERDREAREAQADAEKARLEAERAQERAREVTQDRDQERAAAEERAREADRLDPNVDHKSEDYHPTVPGEERVHDTGAGTETGGTGHRVEGHETETPRGRHVETQETDLPPGEEPRRH